MRRIIRRIENSLFLSTVLNFATYGLDSIVGLATVFLLPRYMGLQALTDYFFVIASAGLIFGLANLGINTYMTRTAALEKGSSSWVGPAALLTKLCTVFPSLLILYFLLSAYTSEAGALNTLMFFCFGQAANFLSGASVALLRAEQRSVSISFGDVLEKVIVAASLGLAAFVYQSFALFAALYALASVVKLIWYFLAVPAVLRLRSVSLSHLRTLLRGGFPFVLTSLSNQINTRLDVFMLGYLAPPIAVAVYGGAYKIIEVFSQFTRITQYYILPEMSKRMNDSPLFGKMLRIQLYVTMLIASVAMPAFILYGDGFLRALYAINEPGVGIAVGILSLTLPFLGATMVFSSACAASKKERRFASVVTKAALFNAASNAVLIPMFSYVGAAATTVVTYMGISFFLGRIFSDSLKGYLRRIYTKPLVVIFASLAIMTLLPISSLVPLLGIYGCVVLMLFFIGGINSFDREIFSSVRSSVSDVFQKG